MTKNGKLLRFSAMVAAGNGHGGVGIGQATHENVQDAVMKAGRLATRNIEYFERWQGRTLFHDDCFKFKATKLSVRPAPPSTKFLVVTGLKCRNRSSMSSSDRRNVSMLGNSRYFSKSHRIYTPNECRTGIS